MGARERDVKYHWIVNRHDHWQRVYKKKPSDGVSWFQPEPTTSLRLIEASGLTHDT
jgi:hypothetical protein